MKNAHYDSLYAKITRPTGESFRYMVYENMIKVSQDEVLQTVEELLEFFYSVIHAGVLADWAGCTIELEYTWGDSYELTTTIYQ